MPLDYGIDPNSEPETRKCSCFKCFHSTVGTTKIYDKKISDKTRKYSRIGTGDVDLIGDQIGVPLLDRNIEGSALSLSKDDKISVPPPESEAKVQVRVQV
jgi:hypothetical protein